MASCIVLTDDLEPGMTVGNAVFGKGRTPLVTQGVVLTENLISSLKKQNIFQVSIHIEGTEEGFDGEVRPEHSGVLPAELDQRGRKKIESVMSNVVKRMAITDADVSQLTSLMSEVIKELFEGGPVMLDKLNAISDMDSVTYDHCWSVAVLSLVLYREACNINWIPHGTAQDAINVGVGALLHDIGKLLVPPEILNKPGALDDEEWWEMRRHPLYGLELARKQPNIMPMARGIIIHHHQRLDGNGYGPQEKENILSGDKIPRVVKLVSVADVYDALSADRPYRPGFIPWSVLKIMRKSVGTSLDSVAMELLEKIVVPFPEGSFLLTSYGAICIVVSSGIKAGYPDETVNPSVRVIATVKTLKKHLPGDIVRIDPECFILGAITLRGLVWRIERELASISEDLSKRMNLKNWIFIPDWRDQIVTALKGMRAL